MESVPDTSVQPRLEALSDLDIWGGSALLLTINRNLSSFIHNLISHGFSMEVSRSPFVCMGHCPY